MLRRVLAVAMLVTSSAAAQEPVKGVPNPETLFTDRNPTLNANKQAALHIMKDLLQCNHWDEADKWLTARYIQHNPNVASGRDPVVKFFGSRPKTPTCDPPLLHHRPVAARGKRRRRRPKHRPQQEDDDN